MKNIRSFILSLALIILVSSAYSQGHHVRIGFIGNSITQGVGLPNPLTQAYPVVAGDLLEAVYGDTCIVKNFGLTTTTMLKNGDVSYWDTKQFKDFLAWAPEICFIMLGTNDTKPYNWDIHGDEFLGDYLAMIDTIKARNATTRFLLAYPPPAYQIVFDIRDSILVHGVMPAVDSVLKLVDAELMDFYYPLLDSVHLFPDFIHPGVDGSRVMAEMVTSRIIETDLIHKADTGNTFITSFKTSKTPLPLNDSAVLSWTSLNADSVLLDGERVDQEGSMKVSPPGTKVYTLVAIGTKTNDTIELVQEVYVPELARLSVYPPSVTRYEGDTVFFQAKYFDQMNIPMTGVYYAVNWSIIEGSGYLFEEGDTSVFFVCETPDTSFLEVSFNEISSEAKIITRASTTGLVEATQIQLFSVYPNPVNEEVHIRTELSGEALQVKIYDLKGVLLRQINFPAKAGQQLYTVRVDDLPAGNYLLNVEQSGGVNTEKFIIRRQ